MNNHGFYTPIDGIRFDFQRISANSKDKLVLSVNGVEGHFE